MAKYKLLVGIAIAAAITAGIAARSFHLSDVRSRSPDEKVYTYYAKQIVDQGVSSIPNLFVQYLAQDKFDDYPPPTRLTTLILDAVVMKTSGVRDERAGVFVTWVFSCLSLTIITLIGVRFLNSWIALTATIFAAFSSIELGIVRRAWQDTTIEFLSLLLIYVTCEIAAKRRRLLWYVSFFLLGVLLLLTKQSGIIAYALSAVWLSWTLARERAWSSLVWFVTAGGVSILTAVAVWTIAAGDFSYALYALDRSIHPGAQAAKYIVSVMSAPWHHFLAVLFGLNPFTFVTAVCGGLICISGSSKRLAQICDPNAAVFIALVTFITLVSFAFIPGGQDLRLISLTMGFYYLLVGTSVYWVITTARMRLPPIFAISVLVLTLSLGVLSLKHEYGVFVSAIVATDIQDLPVSVLWRLVKPM